VFEGVTTGTPIALLIRNQDQRSKDYGNIAELPPGPRRLRLLAEVRHPRLPRRRPLVGAETAVRVAAGAIARKWLESATAS
jgi:chorismate synthase